MSVNVSHSVCEDTTAEFEGGKHRRLLTLMDHFAPRSSVLSAIDWHRTQRLTDRPNWSRVAENCENLTRVNLFLVLQKIESPFLDAVKTTLGDRYTENVENIYKITIKLIIESLVNGYNSSSENKALASTVSYNNSESKPSQSASATSSSRK